MHQAVPLIATIAAAFGMALLLGFVAARLKLPALVGYLLAGIVIGPATPGFVADVAIASQLAEIGVMLLMFGVGLHFSLSELLSVRRIAVPGAVVQMAVATAAGAACAWGWWGWSPAAALVFGLALSVASTVVLLKALEAHGLLETVNGRIAVGWLVVEDLAMVVVLVLLPPLAAALVGSTAAGDPASMAAGNATVAAAPASAAYGSATPVATAASGASELWATLGRTLLAVAAFVALMLAVGRRVFPWLLWQVARTGSRELFTLCVVAAAVGIAWGSAQLFGVSFALGAFFAGMVLRESPLSQRAAEDTLPLRDAFAVLFFVSVGMLFDPAVLVESPGRVLAVVAIIVFGKSAAAALLVLLLKHPLNTALAVSASLAQIGEFSFILAGLGLSLGVLPAEGRSLILAGALISIALNPLVFAAVRPALRWACERSELARRLEKRDDPLAELPQATAERYLINQVVIVGHGRVGQGIAAALRQHGVPFVVADANREVVERLRAEGQAAVLGNAVDPATLIQAHIAHARMLVIATPQTLEVRQMVETARTLNPGVQVVMRSHSVQEAELLRREHAGTVFVGETELARAMTAHVLGRVAGSGPD